ncbi:MAG TPA: serine/threonine-protein kinase [Gemmataceae bacterium]|jgi:serine/threonine protein kinase|nr:serine/threonine-protein kinase [Gemmataceae bacterium]
MIALSCVHCGEKMTVTDEPGGKRGKCARCGHTVFIPPSPSESGSLSATMLSRKAPKPQPPVSSQSTISFPPPAPASDAATRVEPPSGPPAEWLAMLAPPQDEGELGRLRDYRVLRVLGSGGMGVVFQAEDLLLQRPVAIKAMLPALAATAGARQRFLREARSAAQLSHDHIVPIFAVAEERGVPFLVMPFLKGETLDARLKRVRHLELSEVLRVGREIAEGLTAVHAAGLIHRDIKPANVWLEGESARVKILDFGLVRPSGGEPTLTQAGAILGSPAYMAPEQAAGQALDHRCDLFSLGCVLYQASTGALPFRGDDSVAVLVAVVTGQPPSPAELNPHLPSPFCDLVLRLLAKQAVGRPGSAREVSQALAGMEREAD